LHPFPEVFIFCVPGPSQIATICRMHRLFTLGIALLVTANVTLVAQTSLSPSPSSTPPSLRAALLAELHSSHDKAEWFTPMNPAVAGLTAEQAKWVPHNSQGKVDPNANHSVGMLTYHLVYWNETVLARMRGENPASPSNNDQTFNDFDSAHW